MIKLPQQETKSLIALHGWSAVLLGFLLYAVVATGTVAVLSEEIEHWSVGHVREGNPLTADVNSIVGKLAPTVDPEFLEEVGIGHSARGNLQLFFHTHRENESGQIEDYGVQFEIDPTTHAVLNERLGTGLELFRTDPYDALGRFLVNIHTELHMPRPWGLLLTGILGLAMLVAAVSGFMMHRHLFKEMFVLRRKQSDVLEQRDVHTVAGTWGLPFAFILAFTGSFFSFAGSFGFPAMAMVAFGGDQEAMIRTVIGVPESKSEQQADFTNINLIIDDAYQRSGQNPEFASISHYGMDDAKITLFLPPAESKLAPKQYEYSGVSGDFIREKAIVGTVPSLGATAFALIAPLHFGDFAGLLSKAVWVALGFASCYVILTGFSLWIERRRDSHRWHLFERFTLVFGIGLPVAMLASAVGYTLSSVVKINPNLLVPWSFIIVSMLCILGGIVVRNYHTLKIILLGLCTIFCILVPTLRIVSGGPLWVTALQQQNISVAVIDSVLIISAIFSLQQLRRALLKRKSVRSSDTEDAAHSKTDNFNTESIA